MNSTREREYKCEASGADAQLRGSWSGVGAGGGGVRGRKDRPERGRPRGRDPPTTPSDALVRRWGEGQSE